MRAPLLLVVLLAGAAPASAADENGIVLAPAVARPGDAVLVRVTLPPARPPPTATLAGRPLQLWRKGDELWSVAALPLETPSGTAAVELVWGTLDMARSSATLEVVEPGFPSKALTVAPKFVTPPASVKARIARDKRAFAAAYDRPFTPPLFAARFAWPHDGAHHGRYGDQRVFNGKKESVHYGLDIDAPRGAPVRAANDGEVVLARSCFYSGNTVVLWHGADLFTLYFHMDRLDVRPGARVRRPPRRARSRPRRPRRPRRSRRQPLPRPLRRDDREHLREERGRRRKDVARLEHPIAALGVGHRRPRLARDEDPGRDVPRLEPQLPESVEPPRRDVGEVERRASEPAHRAGSPDECAEQAQRLVVVLVDVVRETGDEQRSAELRARRVAQRFAVQERAAAARGREELVSQGIVGRARGEPPCIDDRHVHREVRDAVRVVRGAVERVHEEAEPARARAARARLLGEDGGARVPRGEEGEERGLARLVGVGDEVDPAL